MEEKPNNKPLIIVLILIVAVVAFAFYYFKNLDKNSYSNSSDIALDSSLGQNNGTANTNMEDDVTELKIEDLQVGTGLEAKSGNSVTVHYVGTLLDGTKFDSSRDRGQSFTFTLGTGEVIKGWDQGVPGMKVRGVRKLTIPGDLAYGQYGSPPDIGSNQTLVFEVELLEVK